MGFLAEFATIQKAKISLLYQNNPVAAAEDTACRSKPGSSRGSWKLLLQPSVVDPAVEKEARLLLQAVVKAKLWLWA